MTKTICDICGKEMNTPVLVEPIQNYNFCISRYGKIWDICTDCRGELWKWIQSRREEGEADDS